jgi:hypothetical protein
MDVVIGALELFPSDAPIPRANNAAYLNSGVNSVRGLARQPQFPHVRSAVTVEIPLAGLRNLTESATFVP